MQQQTDKERIAALEQQMERVTEKLAAIEQRQAASENIDAALLVRIDAVGSALRSFERETRSSFVEQSTDIRYIKVTQTQILETLADHKQGIESIAGQVHELAAGQQQVLEILLGQPRRND